jgi:hypothetical protein
MKATKALSVIFMVYLVFMVFSIQSAFGLFYDFENPNQAKDWKIFAGKGAIKDGKYVIEKTDATDGIAAIGTMDWTDCTVTCKATMLDGSTDNIGLVWRLLDGKTFYVVSIRMDQRVGYCGCDNGTWMNGGSPVNPIAFETAIGKEYKLKLVVKGNTFQFFVDGEDMGKWTEDKFKTGMVGIRVWSASMAIDDFDINGPGIAASVVDPQSKIAVAWGEIKRTI